MLLECQYCSALVDAIVKASYDDDDGESPPVRSTFAMCPQCHAPLLALQENFGNGWDTPRRVYPDDEFRLGVQVPELLRNSFGEAQKSFKVRAYTASAIMCRKTLEGLCVDKGFKSGTLATRLKDLRDAQVIESRLYEWADQLRLSGNDAAHDLAITIAHEDARDIMEFTQALLEYVYTFEARFVAFRVRRAKVAGRVP